MEQTMPEGDYMRICYNYSENTSDYLPLNSTGKQELKSVNEFNTTRPKSSQKNENI
jgi:hypothetical protein